MSVNDLRDRPDCFRYTVLSNAATLQCVIDRYSATKHAPATPPNFPELKMGPQIASNPPQNSAGCIDILDVLKFSRSKRYS